VSYFQKEVSKTTNNNRRTLEKIILIRSRRNSDRKDVIIINIQKDDLYIKRCDEYDKLKQHTKTIKEQIIYGKEAAIKSMINKNK
jgi:hypothetical protein